MASESRFFTKFISERRFLSFLVAAATNGIPITFWSFRRNSGVSSSVLVAFSTVATTVSIISLWLASSCDEVVIFKGSTSGVASSCKHTLGSTRLTHISFSSRGTSLVLLFVCVAVVDLVVRLSTSVFIVVCVDMFDRAVSVCRLVVCELFLSTTVGFDVELSPKMIFGKLECFGFVINSLASATCAIVVDCGDDLVFLVCLSLVGGRLCHLGSERLSSRSDVFLQSTETVRPLGFVVFNSARMNPPEKFFVSVLPIVLNLIALINALLQLRFFECERVD